MCEKQKDILYRLARRILPKTIQQWLYINISKARGFASQRHLARMRKRLMCAKGKRPGPEIVHGFRIFITDGPSYYIQYKDIFIRQIYSFKAKRPDPLILDCGSNIGMSIIYFKYVYPYARIIGFEPDPYIFNILSKNVSCNRLKDVELVNAGLGAKKGVTQFLPDGSVGGLFKESGNAISVNVKTLSEYLSETVDFLKLNIEGQELAALREAEGMDRLRNVRELVLEYHGWANGAQELGEILNLLDRQGFRYLVHDFDTESCKASKPPFMLTKNTQWFCLVYAKRI